MSVITRCPVCGTCFRASQEQLEARHGLVRCGRCQGVFNASENLCEAEPSPQLELPIAERAAEPAAAASREFISEQYEATQELEAVAPEAEIPAGASPMTAQAAATRPSRADAPLTLAQQITIVEGAPERRPLVARKKRVWPWAIGSLLLLAGMLAQAAYFLRVELAARAPGLKPALVSYCKMLGCSVPLPRKIDLLSIESSELEADPANASIITLHAVLRNNAPYAQTYPALELAFTDIQDKLLARRTFQPDEYLKPENNQKEGMASRRETIIRLRLDTADLKPAGYRLFLYYPGAP